MKERVKNVAMIIAFVYLMGYLTIGEYHFFKGVWLLEQKVWLLEQSGCL